MTPMVTYLVLVPAQVVGLIAFLAIALGPALIDVVTWFAKTLGGVVKEIHPAQELAVETAAAWFDRVCEDDYAQTAEERRTWELLER